MINIILPKALLAKTELGELELNEAYDEFYQIYPGGEISEQQFLQISKVRTFRVFLLLRISTDKSESLGQQTR